MELKANGRTQNKQDNNDNNDENDDNVYCWLFISTQIDCLLCMYVCTSTESTFMNVILKVKIV